MEKIQDRDFTQGEARAMAAEIVLLREELRLLRAQRFAPTSEKSSLIDGQQLLAGMASWYRQSPNSGTGILVKMVPTA
jgi:hypothetical protein